MKYELHKICEGVLYVVFILKDALYLKDTS